MYLHILVRLSICLYAGFYICMSAYVCLSVYVYIFQKEMEIVCINARAARQSENLFLKPTSFSKVLSLDRHSKYFQKDI